MLGGLETVVRLIHDLKDELQQTRASPTASVSDSCSQAVEAQTTQQTLRTSGQIHDLSSSFWSLIDSELRGLREGIHDSASTEQENAASEPESPEALPSDVLPGDRAPLDRHAFLLRYPSSGASHDVSTFLPMPSQIPFLLEVYAERVHFIIGVPYFPSLKALLQRRRSRPARSDSPHEDALVFAVFYAAICSLDEHEVLASFNMSQQDLALRYRVGLEHSLARADFLNNPCYALVEAITVFLTLARWRDPPKFMFMMTGIVIRMARYLGYHHVGFGAKDTTPFQAEMQRRLWWNLCALDLRATEDLGTELTIPKGSHSTRLPSNINETDLRPEMDQPPVEREGLTSITLLRMCAKIARTTQDMMAASTTDNIEDRVQRLSDLAQELDKDYFAFPDASQHSAYLAAAGVMRVFIGRLTLLAFLPDMFSSPDLEFGSALRGKLLVAAIEMLEHSHALNSDPSCRPWRWVYQTQRHWHAIVYLLIELCRRQWSPTMERAWLALQSPWLVPAHVSFYQNLSVWVPLKRLMARARQHRENEVMRLRADAAAASDLEDDDRQHIPIPLSSATFPTYFNDQVFLQLWQRMVYPTVANNMDVAAASDSTTSNIYSPFPLDASASSSTSPRGVQQSQNVSAAAGSNDGGDTPASRTRSKNDKFTDLDTFFAVDVDVNLDGHTLEDDSLEFDWSGWLAATNDLW